MYRPVTTVSMARLMVSHLKRPQPYARLGHTHSLTYKVGASSLLKYKYPPVPRRRLGHTAASTLSDHDLKAIQDTLEGLRLMSLLKYVHLPTIPSSCSTLHCPSAAPPSPNSHFPPNPGLTLDRVVSHSSRRSIHRRSRSAFSRTVVSPLARPTSLRIRRRIQVPIMSSQSIRLTNPHVPLVKHRFLPSLPFPSLPPHLPRVPSRLLRKARARRRSSARPDCDRSSTEPVPSPARWPINGTHVAAPHFVAHQCF